MNDLAATLPLLDGVLERTLREIMQEEYPHLLETFRDDSFQRLALLRAALAAGAAEEIRQLAHSFKGSSSNMGAVRLAERCRQLESLAREARLDEACACLAALADDLDAVLHRLFAAPDR